jgi:hypothetical protein
LPACPQPADGTSKPTANTVPTTDHTDVLIVAMIPPLSIHNAATGDVPENARPTSSTFRRDDQPAVSPAQQIACPLPQSR